ncbi:uncharacterized protein PAC_20015 [Phialocephala subalpina]|uniref:Heterokaryon incompatibility domain-containing protein n=1 Tax=Phialocephala subalpina TaxID=576137 RepID=A0A1L7XYM8_9HELO|nr:uncharacterized protein PAC_20015 [Phialocephala subalpina]
MISARTVNPASGTVEDHVDNPKSEVLESFCKPCSSIFSSLEALQALVSDNGYEWLTFEEISENARVCTLCRMLKQEGFVEAPTKRLQLQAETDGSRSNTPVDTCTGYPSGILSMCYLRRIVRINGAVSTSEDRRVLTISKIPDDESAPWLTCFPRSYDLAGDAAMSSCLTRLKHCQEKHKDCEPRTIPLLPTRVIDIEHPSHPKLCISKRDQRACYVALSYSWGGPQEVQLTRDTLDTKVKGLQLQDLPQTIRDAIEVTGKLGLRYLWIDAFCIIQNDTEDQNLEIKTMGRIYRNATLTIAASDSKSVRNGFLKSRNPYSSCNLPFYLPNGRLGKAEVTHWKQTASQSKWHLNTRAWALQEELLSPRILFFPDGEIRWQCQSVYKERLLGVSSMNFEEWQGLHRLPPGVFADTGNVGLAIQGHHLSDEKDLKQQLRLEQLQVWGAVIENYTKRKIMNPQDRLPALAGIITALEKPWADKCVAGMWENCFIEHLYWRRSSAGILNGCLSSNPKHRVCRCNSVPRLRGEKSAPTWSWLSCGQAVTFGEIKVRKCEILSSSVQLLDKTASLGSITGGRLVVRASVIKGPLRRDIGPKFRSDPNISLDSLDICGFTCHEIFERAIYARLGTYILSPRLDPNDTRNRITPCGIVLMEVENGLFERVGAFYSSDEDPQRDMFDDSSISELRTLTIV